MKIAPPGPSAVAAVHGRVDHRDVTVLIRVKRAAVAVGRVAVDVRADHQDVPGRADRPARAVDEVGVDDRVEHLHAAPAGVDAPAVVVREVARDDRPDDRRSALRHDPAARFLGEVLVDLGVDHHDLAPSRHGGTRAVATPARERHIPELHEARAVLAEQPLLEAHLSQRVAMPVQEHRALRLAHRVAQLTRPQEDVRGDVDRGHARVAPRRPQLRLRVDRQGLLLEQRVAVTDPPAALAAHDARLVDALDLIQAPLGAAVAHHSPLEEAVAKPAAPEEHRPDAPRVDAPVAAALAPAFAVQAALIAPHHARGRAAARAHHPDAEHGAWAGAARRRPAGSSWRPSAYTASPRPRPPRRRSKDPAGRRSAARAFHRRPRARWPERRPETQGREVVPRRASLSRLRWRSSAFCGRARRLQARVQLV